MKKMKKFASLLLALVLCFALAAPVSAAGTGSITVDGAIAGQDYTIYRILDLVSYDAANNKFSYVANSNWAAWLATKTDYVTFDGSYVLWKDGASAADFAAEAIAYAEANSIPAIETKTADASGVSFTGLDLGYYLVDSTLGALCSLDTTIPNVTIREKNTPPTIDKRVKDEATDNYVDETTAQIGKIVEFATIINVYPGAVGYTFHDSMTEGLTLLNTAEKPIEVYYTPISAVDKVDPSNYTVVIHDPADPADDCTHTDGKVCTFHVEFTQAFLDTITEHDQLSVRYYAEVNEDALIYNGTDATANLNDARLTYGNDTSTDWDTAKVKVYDFELVKTDTANQLLDGAFFSLYDAASAGNLIKLYQESATSFRIATADEITADVNIVSEFEVEGGRVIISGLAAGETYYLEETKAPTGYNLLAGRVAVEVEEASGAIHVNGVSHYATISGTAYESGGVRIENRAGTMLPSTGGIGTTIFYVMGSCLALGALILFLTKRRMAVEG